MSRYETSIDLDNPNNSQTQLITLVGRDKVVLDVGCAAGDTAQALASRGCVVSGIDIDAAAAEPARAVLEELVIADIDRDPLSEHFKPASFDAILFGDVLEHLVDPWNALRDAITLLRPEGRVLVSIPNVAHASVRLSLLLGEWRYTEKGLLDRTHLRFFTLEGVLELLESAGLVVEELRSTVLDPMSTAEITVDADRLPPTVIEWVRHQPEALNYQYVAAARPLREGERRGRRPELVPAIPYDAARVRDRHTEQMLADQEERHRMLTIRDHIIGLEAASTAAQARTARVRARARRLQRRNRDAVRSRKELERTLERIAASRRPGKHLRDLLGRLRSQRAAGGRDS